MGISLTGRFEWVWVVLGGSAYVYYVVLRAPVGHRRLLALLPLLPFYLLVPYRAHSTVERGLMSFFFLWVSAFKLVTIAYGYGPALDSWMMSSYPRFVAGLSFTLHTQANNSTANNNLQKIRGGLKSYETVTEAEGKTTNGGPLRRRKGQKDVVKTEKYGGEGKNYGSLEDLMPHWLSHLAFSRNWSIVLFRCACYLVFVGFWLQQYLTGKHIPELLLYMSYSILLYVGVLFMFELPTAIAGSVFKVELPAQFNMPYLATSLTDFWGRRWNLLVNNLLRVSVYTPVLDYFSSRRSGKAPSPGEKALAVFASFLVSGIMHEIIFVYLNEAPPTFEVTLFFVLNGAATVVERWFRVRNFSPPHILLRWVGTISFVFFTAAWLFFPPLVRNNTDKRSIQDMNKLVFWLRDLLIHAFKPPFLSWRSSLVDSW